MATATDDLEVVSDDNIDFEYKFATLGDLQVQTVENEKTGKKKVSSVMLDGEPIEPTDRFWNSVFSRYGISNTLFKYYDHDEVFARIMERDGKDRMRMCIERGDNGNRLLAVSSPTKPIVSYSDMSDLLSRYGGRSVKYSNGLIESVHQPRDNGSGLMIGPDNFERRFIMSVPIDGYGSPNVYLSLLRLLCSNLAVAYSKTFRSSLSLGKADDNVMPALTRVLESFGNDEGYAALRDRIESAQKSWASVYEATMFTKLIHKLHTRRDIDDLDGRKVPDGTSIAKWYSQSRDEFTPDLNDAEDAILQAPIFRSLEAMTGNPMRLYGIANIDALSAKRQRTLPVKCTVYDLVNFSTEVATHYAGVDGSRKLQGWVGNTLSAEYDMEGTRDKFTDFADFHMSEKFASGLTGSNHALDN